MNYLQAFDWNQNLYNLSQSKSTKKVLFKKVLFTATDKTQSFFSHEFYSKQNTDWRFNCFKIRGLCISAVYTRYYST